MRFATRAALLSLCFSVLALPSLSIAPHDHEGEFTQKIRRAPAPTLEWVSAAEDAAPSQAFEGFVADVGGQWWGRLDARTGRALLIAGSGLKVAERAIDGDALPSLEQRVRQIIARHPGLLAPAQGELVLSPRRSQVLRDGRVVYVDFDLAIGGRAVRGASVFARINNGNIVQLGTSMLDGEADPAPATLDAEAAYERLFAYVGGRGELDERFGEAELFYLPVDQSGRRVYRLVYEVAFRRAGDVETWTARVDARTGEIVEFFDGNHYEGAVSGGVFPRTVVDDEVELPFPFVNVDGVGATDGAGQFAYTGGLVSSGLDGPYFNTVCEACVDPPQARASTETGLGLLRFGLGGTDGTGNGVSTRAERNSFFHLSLVRLQAKKFLSIGWLDSNIRSTVNIQDTCNAFYNGTVNFYRSGGGCNNTGEIADVMQHEWGHGIDNETLGGDSATGEGTADHVAFLMQRDPVIGPYFRTTGSGVRHLDWRVNTRGLLTRDNVGSKCGTGSCSGALGYQCHCEGEIYGQTGWDLSLALVDKHGEQTGWLEHERIFYQALPQSGGYLPENPNAIYDAYLAVDDDDGNLSNGTPNGQEIFEAFDRHGIAGTNVGSSPYCTRPAEPLVSAETDCAGVTLSWDAVPGVVEYRISKNWVDANTAYLPVATVTGTSYVDSEVRPGITYHYLVEAVDGSGCTSTVESIVTVEGPQRPVLNVYDVGFTDTPVGNRSGTVDPGESVLIFADLENVTDVVGTGLVGTLTSNTPGVTVEVGTQDFPDSLGLDTTSNVEGFQIALDETVECGSMIELALVVADDSGCNAPSQALRLKVGVDEIREQDTFATELGWFHDAASSTASSGDWTRGVPDGTSYQASADSDDEGDLCWFTAPNPGGDGSDDVDDGEVVLLSPTFDLSTMSDPQLEYQRWFGNRDIGEDPDDYFWVEASDNDGASWVTVERLGSEESAPQWTPRRYDLASLIALTDQVRFRVRVTDGTLDGNLIEGGFDDFRITEPTCDDTPPCFVPPTFAGIESATAGPDCAETTLGWSAASTNCQNATISYSVYRSLDEGFTPSESSLVATGLSDLGYQDTLLQPDTTYHYIVRADDTRSGQDANLELGTVVSPSGPDTKAPLFSGLESVSEGAGCGETLLSWSPALETCSAPVVYRVYRSETPGFTPAPELMVAETTDITLTDAALAPNEDYYYVVQAVDQEGLADGNLVEGSATATVLDELLSLEDFESGANGWARSGLNDAATGLWELGDPDQTDAQPGTCPSGANCWATGLAASSLGDNDIDSGTTTLVSEIFDMTGLETPAIRYQRYYSNNTGSEPGTDTWTVEISNDDGANWSTVESTNQSDEGLVFSEVEFPLEGVLAPTDQMRVRFIAADLDPGSLVEAVVDDFSTVDLTGGCDDCGPTTTVGTILVTRDGADVLLDWTGDPAEAARFKVYTLEGADFSDTSLLGTSVSKGYRHVEGTRYGQLTSYRVSAVDACGQEGALQ